MLERDIEQPFVKWCKQVGIKVKKKNFADQLDRWLMVPGGAPIIIEFKAPGKKPTPLQQREIDELWALGYAVKWFAEIEAAIAWVLHMLDAQHECMRRQEQFTLAEECRSILNKAVKCQKFTNPTPTKRKQ